MSSIPIDVFAVREREAARLLGVSYSVMKLWRRQGIGPVYSRLNSRVITYTPQALKDFVDRNAVTVDPPEAA